MTFQQPGNAQGMLFQEWAPITAVFLAVVLLDHVQHALLKCLSTQLFQALSHFSVLQVTQGWMGPGNEANVGECALHLYKCLVPETNQ